MTEWALPGLECPCCGTVTVRGAAAWRIPGLGVSYGPVLNAAAVVLTAYGNVPPERAAQVMAMLLGVPVSPGWAARPARAGCASWSGKPGN